MKVNKSFRLSEEACRILSEQSNATQFVEDLIMDTPRQRKMEVVSLHQLQGLLEDYTVEKKSLAPQKTDWQGDGVPRACCLGDCKHWVYSMDVGATINTITGETRDNE